MKRRTVRTALVVGLIVLTTACTDSEDDGSEATPSTSSSGKDVPEVPTVITVEKVSGRLDDTRRHRVKAGVDEAVDQWFDGAYLGAFPRSDYEPAFDGFTPGAQEDAQRDLDLLSNRPISDRIERAVAINRRVRLDVLAPAGTPRAATARFVLDFRTTGELEGPRRVTGQLYLTRQLGEWRVFGYDVVEAAPR